MAKAVIAPEKEIYPKLKRWTVSECYRLMDKGYLTGRWELIDGVIISKMGQKTPHSIALTLVLQWLLTISDVLQIRIQLPLGIPGRAGRNNKPEPDAAVTEKPIENYSAHPTSKDVLLLVEVSDSTLRFDLTTKAALYAQAGVKEYWVLDIPNRKLHCHRNPLPNGYDEVTVYEEADLLSPLARPDAFVRVGDLLPAE